MKKYNLKSIMHSAWNIFRKVEGITFGDGKKATDRMAEDIMALKADGTICFLGWAGHMCYHQSRNAAIRIDYEKYIDGADDYIIVPGKGE